MELIHWIGHHNSLKKDWINNIGNLILSNQSNAIISKESFFGRKT